MISFRKIEKISEIKMGMILSIRRGTDNIADDVLRKVDCIDNGLLHYSCVINNHPRGFNHLNESLLDIYTIHEVVSDGK